MDWEQRYLDDDTPWDTGAPCPVVLELAEHNLTSPGDLLVPGCGPGHEVRALAKRGHRVTGLDISPTAVARAQELLGGIPGAAVIQADLMQLPPELRSSADAWIEHTCLCALEPSDWTGYATAAHTALRPGGLLMGSLLYFSGGGPPYGIQPAEIDLVFGPLFDVITLELDERLFHPRGCPQLRVVLQRRDKT